MTSATENPRVERPKEFEKYRETRFEYSENLGEASKSIRIEAYLTNDELIELFCWLIGVER